LKRMFHKRNRLTSQEPKLIPEKREDSSSISSFLKSRKEERKKLATRNWITSDWEKRISLSRGSLFLKQKGRGGGYSTSGTVRSIITKKKWQRTPV